MKNLLILLCAFSSAFAQPLDTLWTYTYSSAEDDEAEDIFATRDGGFVVGGRGGLRTGEPDESGFLIKLDNEGHEQWIRHYLGEFTRINALIETSVGGLAMTGSDPGFIITVTDSVGNIEWMRTAGYTPTIDVDRGVDIVETYDGSIVALTWGSITAAPDIDLLKYSAEGDSLWTRTYGGIGSEHAYDLLKTPDNGFIILGEIELDGSAGGFETQAYVVKADENGFEEWTRAFGEVDSSERLMSGDILSDGSIIVAGLQTRESWIVRNPYVARLTPTGDTLWTRSYPELGPIAWDCTIRELPTGEIGLGLSYNENMFVVILDGSGEVLNTNVFTFVLMTRGRSMCLANDGSLVLAGFNISNQNNQTDLFVLRTESILGVENFPSERPLTFSLYAYPNPFNAETTLKFSLDHPQLIELTLYNQMGQAVETLMQGQVSAGDFSYYLSADFLPSGTYYAQLNTQDCQFTRKLVLIK